MTFDDGVLKIYNKTNTSDKGLKPLYQLVFFNKYYFKFDTVGINRYYTALQFNKQIEDVVNIPDWEDITTNDICILEDDQQYTIDMVQKLHDENNLKITKLSLVRLKENYDIYDDTITEDSTDSNTVA